MTLHYEEPGQRDIDYLVQMAARNVCEGVIEEPRAYWDELTLLGVTQVSRGAPGVLVNGEQFPVRLTHISMALIPVGVVGTDERFIQRVGARLVFHDNYYMSRDFVAAPLWANKVVAAGDANTAGNSSLIFCRPNILSARDSLRFELQLNTVPDSARLVSAAVTGVGMLSKRPYFFSDAISIDNMNIRQLSTAQFRNDGSEPVALTDMSVSCGAPVDDAVGQGDIRELRLNVRQIGNGTQANWFQGPNVPAPLTRIPAQLLGYGTGRGIVHRFPGEGVMWEPGTGVTLEMQALDASVVGMNVGFSLYGYISVV
jgi:hypothetical protein